MKSILATSAAFFFSLILALADQKGHAHDHDHHHDHGVGHHPTIFIPSDLGELWSHINAYSAAVIEFASAGDTDAVHKELVNLEALIGSLEAASESMEASKKDRTTGMLANTTRALGQLHEATDGEDVPGMQKAAKSLKGVMALLKAQYPKEVTSGVAEVKDDIGPHNGMLASFASSAGEAAGYLELKLHDDKGDLELWLAKDAAISQPYDLSADSVITVTFEGAQKDSASLVVRNLEKNEDEDGSANMRSGKTNYFIYPGDSGVDASWLAGKDFEAMVKVGFGNNSTKAFKLIPHIHHDHGHGHDHDHDH
ncbi:MAG: hypothetical protein AAGH89_01705 [Verrucomicrobiota bacterium]